MDSKSKSAAAKTDAKGVSHHRASRKEAPRPLSGDPKKISTARKTNETRPNKPPRATNGHLVQQKTRMATSTSWVRGGSSLSFADVVRKKNEAEVVNLHVEQADPSVSETETVEHDVVAATHDHDLQKPVVGYSPSNENEEVTYSATLQPQHEAPIVPTAVPACQDDDVDEVRSIKYYVLEIDRILEESVLLPSHATAIAAEYVGFCTFSGQVGKPPTAPALSQVQSQFYRPEPTAARSFSGMGGASDMNRGQHWISQSSHSADYAGPNWSLQERGQRGFHQTLQYNSYAAPLQQQPAQRNFVTQTVNRILQNDLPDVPLRQIRDAGAFSRHTGNGGGVW